MRQPKSSAPATTKALQAWQSELRRLERRLREWEERLNQQFSVLNDREEILKSQEDAFAAAIENADGETVQLYADRFSDDAPDDGDCGCTAEDAASNCDCPKCEKQRTDWVGTGFQPMRFDWSIGLPPERKHALMNNPVGDEVNWLENLWKLEDKRKKKK